MKKTTRWKPKRKWTENENEMTMKMKRNWNETFYKFRIFKRLYFQLSNFKYPYFKPSNFRIFDFQIWDFLGRFWRELNHHAIGILNVQISNLKFWSWRLRFGDVFESTLSLLTPIGKAMLCGAQASLVVSLTLQTTTLALAN